MAFRCERALGGALLTIFTVAITPMGARAAETPIDLVGVTEATLRWDPASGPVSGYYVIVSRNGGESSVESFSSDTEEIVAGAYGDTLVVQVAAFDPSGIAGPLSPPSTPLRFVEATAPPAGDPPPPDGGGTGGDAGAGGSGQGTGGTGGGDPVHDAPVDFTGDGLSDLVFRTELGDEVEVWTMAGAEVVSTARIPALPDGWEVVGSGDYDGNGTADLLWQESGTPHLTVWLFTGGAVSGGGPAVGIALEADGDWQVGGSGDFDGDGRDDVLLFSRRLGVAEIWSLDGEQVLAERRIDGHLGAWSVAAIVDCDGDGRDEIVWRSEIGEALHLARLDDVGVTEVLLADGLGDRRVVGVADYDGDGRSDLMLRDRIEGGLEVWSLDGPTVAAVTPWAGSRPEDWQPVAAGDYDGNGLADVAWLDASGGVELWLTQADRIVVEAASQAPESGAALVSGRDGSDDSAFRRRLCSADYNGDGIVGGADFAAFGRCIGSEATGSCAEKDADGDGVVGSLDFALFSQLWGGPDCPNGW